MRGLLGSFLLGKWQVVAIAGEYGAMEISSTHPFEVSAISERESNDLIVSILVASVLTGGGTNAPAYVAGAGAAADISARIGTTTTDPKTLAGLSINQSANTSPLISFGRPILVLPGQIFFFAALTQNVAFTPSALAWLRSRG